MKRLLFLIVLALSAAFCRAQIPEFSNRLVNDYADVLSNSDERAMETRLRNYYDTTSNCIIVVIINDLGGYEASDFAQRMGEKWGVGTGKYSNGLVILLSPEGHEIFIATGYGLEGVLPDVTCHRIAENYMKPHFQEEEYYEGLEAGLDIILPVAAKEYSFEEYQKERDAEDMEALMGLVGTMGGVVICLVLIGFIANYRKKHPSKKKLALQAIADAQSKEAFDAAVENARALKIANGKIEDVIARLRQRCVKDISAARTYRGMVDRMSLALELGADEQAVQQAREGAVAGIIAAIGDARSARALQSAIREAELAGAKEHEVERGRERARAGTLNDLAHAGSLAALRELESAAMAFGARADEVRYAKEQAARNVLDRIRKPASVSEVAEAEELAEALGVPGATLASAKEDGKRYAMEMIAEAQSSGEIRAAAELALYLGAAALAVKAAEKLAKARLRQSAPGGGMSWGGGGFSGRGSSGTFGGFGGGHFGGGGGGAKW